MVGKEGELHRVTDAQAIKALDAWGVSVGGGNGQSRQPESRVQLGKGSEGGKDASPLSTHTPKRRILVNGIPMTPLDANDASCLSAGDPKKGRDPHRKPSNLPR